MAMIQIDHPCSFFHNIHFELVCRWKEDILNFKECDIKLFGWVGGSRELGMAWKYPLNKSEIPKPLPSSYWSTRAKLRADKILVFLWSNPFMLLEKCFWSCMCAALRCASFWNGQSRDQKPQRCIGVMPRWGFSLLPCRVPSVTTAEGAGC